MYPTFLGKSQSLVSQALFNKRSPSSLAVLCPHGVMSYMGSYINGVFSSRCEPFRPFVRPIEPEVPP